MDLTKILRRLLVVAMYNDEPGGGGMLEGAAAELEREQNPGSGEQQPGSGEQTGHYMKFGEEGAIGERPDWVPENFWDGDKGFAVDKAMGSYAEARTKMDAAIRSGQALDKDGALDKPEAYLEDLKIEAGEDQDISRWGEVTAEDPAAKAWAATAHKHGLSKARMESMMTDFLAFSGEHLPEPIDMDAEFAALGGQEAAKKTMAGVVGHLKAMTAAPDEGDIPGSLSQQEYQALLRVGATAAGVSGIAKLVAAARGDSSSNLPTINGNAEGGAVTAEQVHAMQGEVVKDGPHKGKMRYSVDPAFAKQVDDAWAALYGTGRTRTSSSLPIPGA